MKKLHHTHMTTVNYQKSVRRSKYFLEFSITWGQLKISRWSFHSRTIFEAYLTIKFPTILWNFIFSQFTPQARLFFVRKRKPKIFGFKNVIERWIKKFSFITRQIASNIFGKKTMKPGFAISKRLKFPYLGWLNRYRYKLYSAAYNIFVKVLHVKYSG